MVNGQIIGNPDSPLTIDEKTIAMIKTLRKRHLQIWILWGVLLPVGIIIAYISVPKKVTQELLQQPAPKTSTLQLNTIDSLKAK